MTSICVWQTCVWGLVEVLLNVSWPGLVLGSGRAQVGSVGFILGLYRKWEVAMWAMFLSWVTGAQK